MVESLVFRTDDGTRWGTGQGSDLAAVTIDLNFWKLFFAVNALETAPNSAVGIDFITLVGGNQLFIHLTDHTVQGPFVVPTTLWTPRGDFLAGQIYYPLDVISARGALYIVNVQHTAVAPFNPNATDGVSNFLYTLLLAEPQNALPDGGTIGQRLERTADSPFGSAWVSDKIRLAPQIFGKPDAAELVMQYLVVDHMTIPANLEGSAVYSRVNATSVSAFTIDKSGVEIGTITFAPSPLITVDFPSSINFIPGDAITVTAPALQDATLADISFTFVALLTE
jgi:hypothetical protein